MSGLTLTPLLPSGYARFPWKNGGGVTTDIAAAYREGAPPGTWDATIWRLGRTAIVAPGAFSDLAGFDRCQVVVAGRGLVLDTPEGEVDLREPYRPVRYRGEAPIASRLEDGPVEVVNLIADRAAVEIGLAVLTVEVVGDSAPSIQIVYALEGDDFSFTIDGALHDLPPHHALHIDAPRGFKIAARSGRAILASITPRAGSA